MVLEMELEVEVEVEKSSSFAWKYFELALDDHNQFVCHMKGSPRDSNFKHTFHLNL